MKFDLNAQRGAVYLTFWVKSNREGIFLCSNSGISPWPAQIAQIANRIDFGPP